MEESRVSVPVGLDGLGAGDGEKVGEKKFSEHFLLPARGLRRLSSQAHERPEGRMRGPRRSSKGLICCPKPSREGTSGAKGC